MTTLIGRTNQPLNPMTASGNLTASHTLTHHPLEVLVTPSCDTSSTHHNDHPSLIDGSKFIISTNAERISVPIGLNILEPNDDIYDLNSTTPSNDPDPVPNEVIIPNDLATDLSVVVTSDTTQQALIQIPKDLDTTAFEIIMPPLPADKDPTKLFGPNHVVNLKWNKNPQYFVVYPIGYNFEVKPKPPTAIITRFYWRLQDCSSSNPGRNFIVAYDRGSEAKRKLYAAFTDLSEFVEWCCHQTDSSYLHYYEVLMTDAWIKPFLDLDITETTYREYHQDPDDSLNLDEFNQFGEIIYEQVITVIQMVWRSLFHHELNLNDILRCVSPGPGKCSFHLIMPYHKVDSIKKVLRFRNQVYTGCVGSGITTPRGKLIGPEEWSKYLDRQPYGTNQLLRMFGSTKRGVRRSKTIQYDYYLPSGQWIQFNRMETDDLPLLQEFELATLTCFNQSPPNGEIMIVDCEEEREIHTPSEVDMDIDEDELRDAFRHIDSQPKYAGVYRMTQRFGKTDSGCPKVTLDRIKPSMCGIGHHRVHESVGAELVKLPNGGFKLYCLAQDDDSDHTAKTGDLIITPLDQRVRQLDRELWALGKAKKLLEDEVDSSTFNHSVLPTKSSSPIVEGFHPDPMIEKLDSLMRVSDGKRVLDPQTTLEVLYERMLGNMTDYEIATFVAYDLIDKIYAVDKTTFYMCDQTNLWIKIGPQEIYREFQSRIILFLKDCRNRFIDRIQTRHIQAWCEENAPKLIANGSVDTGKLVIIEKFLISKAVPHLYPMLIDTINELVSFLPTPPPPPPPPPPPLRPLQSQSSLDQSGLRLLQQNTSVSPSSVDVVTVKRGRGRPKKIEDPINLPAHSESFADAIEDMMARDKYFQSMIKSLIGLLIKYTRISNFVSRLGGRSDSNYSIIGLKPNLALELIIESHASQEAAGSVRNSVLKTKIRERTCDDYLTHQLPFNYIPNSKSDLLDEFFWGLKDIRDIRSQHPVRAGFFLGNRERAQYFFQLLGNVLLKNPAQIYTFIVGDPASGKSTLIGLILAIFGQYATEGNRSAFFGKNANVNASALAPQLMDLSQRLLVTVSDVQAREMPLLNYALLNTLAGGDRINARTHYGQCENLTQLPTIFIISNDNIDMSKVQNGGIARKYNYFPAEAKFRFPDHPNPDKRLDPNDPTHVIANPNLKKQLESPSDEVISALFDLILVGARQLVDNGYKFNYPADVATVIAETIAERDNLGNWMTETLITDSTARLKSIELLASYNNWLKDRGIEQFTAGPKNFGKLIVKRGVPFSVDRKGINCYHVKWIQSDMD
jgi:hypothetical protein